jgi:hypothetical protein
VRSLAAIIEGTFTSGAIRRRFCENTESTIRSCWKNPGSEKTHLQGSHDNTGNLLLGSMLSLFRQKRDQVESPGRDHRWWSYQSSLALAITCKRLCVAHLSAPFATSSS